MQTCVPIKDMKDTAAFAATVENADGPVIVTRNGRAAFAVMTMEELDSLRLEASRSELYRLVSEAEGDLARGRLADARASQAQARARYGL